MSLKRQRRNEMKVYKSILLGLTQSKTQKEKLSALNELNLWIKNPESGEPLEGADWENLISGFFFEYEKQLAQVASKSPESKAGMVVVMNWTSTFKDLIILAASSHENPFVWNLEERKQSSLKLWDSILFILERNKEIKMITKAMTKCLSILVQKRSFREHLESNQIESFFSYCARFFLDDSAKGNGDADRRPECMDLSICLSVLITSSKNKMDMLANSSKLLKLIQKYICLYRVENNATEYFLTAAQKLLLLIDVNNLNLSYRFLNHILWRLLDLIKSKNENTRNLAINLLRMYISVGSFRPDIEGEEANSKKLIYESIRIQKEILHILENNPANIPIEYFFILESNSLPSCQKMILPQHICHNWSLLNLAADICWLILQSEDRGLYEAMNFRSDVSSEREFQGEGSRKKLKLDLNPKSRLLSFFTSSKPSLNLTGVQLVIIMLIRHETLAEKIIRLYGDFFETLISSHDHPLAFASCIFFSKIFTVSPDLAKKTFNCKHIWASVSSCLTISKRKPNLVYGPFGLLKVFLVNKLPSTDQILNFMHIILSMDPWWFAVEDFLPCFNTLLSFGNLWTRSMIRSLNSAILNAMDYFCQNSIAHHCILIPQMLLLIMEIEIPQKISSSEWYSSSLFTSIAPSYYIFENSFQKFQQRVLKSSGFYGKDLISEIISPLKEKKIPTLSNEKNNVRIDIFIDCLEDFMNTANMQTDEETILWFFLAIKIVLNSIPSTCLEKRQRVLELFSSEVEKKVFSKLYEKKSLVDILFSLASKAWSLGKLTPYAEDWLLQIISRVLPIKDVEEDIMDLNGVTISKTSDVIKLSTYDDSIDISFCLELEKEISACFFLASIFNNKRPLQNYVLEKLSQSSVVSFLVFGSYWEKFEVFIEDAEFSVRVLEWFTESFISFKFEKNPILHGSCIRFLSMITTYPIFSSNSRISELAFDLINYFCEYSLTASSELREDFCVLLYNLISIAEISRVSQIRPIERCWSLLDMSEFHFRFYFAKEAIPILLKYSKDINTIERGFQILKSLVLHSGNTEVESISAAMIYSSFFLHCIPLRIDTFTILCLIASDHPALDTIESIIEELSEYYSCTSLTGPGISMIYFEEILGSFDLETLNGFPYFLFGAFSEDSFRIENMESIDIALSRSKRFSSIPGRLIEKSFSKLYAEYVLTEDPSSANQIMQAFLDYFGSEEHLVNAISRQKSNIISHILLGMRGIQHDPNLPGDFKVILDSLGIKNLYSIQQLNPIINAGSAVKAIKNMLLHYEGSENAFLFLLLQIFNKFHQKLYSYGRLEDLANILINGYQSLLILAESSLFHPLIFQVLVSQLCRFVSIPTTRSISVLLIKHIALKITVEQRYECLSDHSILLLSCLNGAMRDLEKNHEEHVSQLFLSCIELIISCVDQYSSKVNDNGLSIKMACAVLDNPKFLCLLKKFQCDIDDCESLIKLCTFYEPSYLRSGEPFHRLAAIIDNPLTIKNMSELLPLAQHVYFLLSNPAVVASDIIKALVTLFAKLSFHLEMNTLNITEKSKNIPFLKSDDDYLSTIQILISYLMSDAETVIKCTSVLGRLLAEPEVDPIIFDKDIKIAPYISILRGKKRSVFAALIDTSDLVFSSSGLSDSQWLTQFTSKLILKFNYPNFFRILHPLLEENADIAAKMLPILIHFKLFQELNNAEPSETNLTLSLVEFFQSKQDPLKNMISYKYLLNVLKFLLKKDKEFSLFDGWTLLDCSSLSNLSILVGDPVFSIYLLEFWFARTAKRQLNSEAWQCLLQANRELNNSTGFQGVIASLDTKNIDIYHLIEEKNCHEKNWMSLWSMEDSILQSYSENSHLMLHKSLSSSGHYQSLASMLETDADGPHLNEYYECLWRLGKWSIHDAFDDFQNTNLPQVDRDLYNCLERFANSSSFSSLKAMMDKQLVNLKSMKGNNLAMVPFIEVQEACEIIKESEKMNELLIKWDWRLKEMLKIQNFEDIERILAVRTRILITMHQKNSSNPNYTLFARFLSDHLLSISNMALLEKNVSLARTSALQFQKLFENVASPVQKIKLKILLLKIEWERGEQTIAMKFFKETLDSVNVDSDEMTLLKAELYHNYGKWLIASRKSTPIQIIEEYLEPAILLDNSNGIYYYDLAKYADSVYSDILNDENLKRSEKLFYHRENELSLLQQETASKSRDYFLRKIKRQIELDKATLEEAYSKRNRFLLICIENYLKALMRSERKIEHSISRLISLWFSNHQSAEVNAIVKKNVYNVKSSLFLPLMYQLSARFSSIEADSQSPFFSTLGKLVESIIFDYPYHTIGYLVALKNVARGKQKAGIATNTNAFLKRLLKSDLKYIIVGFDTAFSAYISAASQEISKKGSKVIDGKRIYLLESNSAILDLKSSHCIPVLTCDFPVLKPKDYSETVFVEKIERNYTLPGGINAPKVLECLGTNGIVYKQLIKSKDDLRQDAVLSSVFSMINNLLKQKKSTKKKNLTIRTYKVVPLAPQAGIVQWVDGTRPFGEILLEAYSRIKCAWTPLVCREKMKTEQEKFGSTVSSKLALFQQIHSHLPVIFGKVFFSLYRDPTTWYQNRSNYMKSVATSSMGGWMLGVGDRHSQNLLFDEKTGEIIHIDLGIAFDQGKLLSTPETVPFRLTRNMIDAMGITKYEGEFKISSENTLQVLRDERDVLFTLLDVFRHDPLHTWTISPFKMKKIQPQDHQQEADLEGVFAFSKTETEGNVEADIALFGINKKLSSTLSVECQVQELITTAIDPKNLCNMFHGWQSWI